MQARVCIQNYDNGDVQGYLFIDTGTGEQLVTTSPRYTSGGKGSTGFPISGTVGPVSVDAFADISGGTVDFDISTNGGATSAMITRSLSSSVANCIV